MCVFYCVLPYKTALGGSWGGWPYIYIYAPAFEPPLPPPKGHGTPLPPCGVVWGGLGLVVVVVVGVVLGLVVVVVVVVVVIVVVVVLVVHDII